MYKRLFPLLCALILLSPAFLLRSRGGYLQYYEYTAACWHSTCTRSAALPNAADRALLVCGIPLEDRAALTRALEDFCS